MQKSSGPWAPFPFLIYGGSGCSPVRVPRQSEAGHRELRKAVNNILELTIGVTGRIVEIHRYPPEPLYERYREW
jgi:hypothetical protein